MTQTLVVGAGLFFSGALLGCLRPRRVWRWPVASFLAFGASDLVRLAGDPRFTGLSSSAAWISLADNASLYAIHTVPVLVGAYLGCYMTSRGLE